VWLADAGLVRLSFHDAATWDQTSQTGGPDGCMLMDDPANGGILQIADIVEDIYQEYQARSFVPQLGTPEPRRMSSQCGTVDVRCGPYGLVSFVLR
jgi:hypothetical protein